LVNEEEEVRKLTLINKLKGCCFYVKHKTNARKEIIMKQADYSKLITHTHIKKEDFTNSRNFDVPIYLVLF